MLIVQVFSIVEALWRNSSVTASGSPTLFFAQSSVAHSLSGGNYSAIRKQFFKCGPSISFWGDKLHEMLRFDVEYGCAFRVNWVRYLPITTVFRVEETL